VDFHVVRSQTATPGQDCAQIKDPQKEFMRADLSGADFSDADLSGASFEGADLSGADFTEADLRGTNMYGAKGLTDEQIRDFKLRGARFDPPPTNQP